MRRVVTVLILVMVAMSLAACGGAPAATDTTGTSGTPAAGAPVAAPPVAAVTPPAADTLSPTQTVKPGEMFPTDKTVVPASVLSALSTKMPLMVVWLDQTTKVAANQRAEVKWVMQRYKGLVTLVNLDYTAGLISATTSATLDPETQKVELLASALQINTTPYILFVDRFGRITYRYAGYTDRQLLKREVLRATE